MTSGAEHFYDSFAPCYELAYGEIDADETVRQWSQLLDSGGRRPRGGRLLDVGCGPGHYLEPWAKAGYVVEGLDVSALMIRRAARRSSATLHRLDVRDLSTRVDLHGRFDVVVAHFNFLHLFPPGELRAVLRAIIHAVCGGGVLISDLSPTAEASTAVSEHYGGRLVVDRILDASSRRIVSRWRHNSVELPPEIFWFHDPEHIRLAASAAGWEHCCGFRWRPQERPAFARDDAMSDRSVMLLYKRVDEGTE